MCRLQNVIKIRDFASTYVILTGVNDLIRTCGYTESPPMQYSSKIAPCFGLVLWKQNFINLVRNIEELIFVHILHGRHGYVIVPSYMVIIY